MNKNKKLKPEKVLAMTGTDEDAIKFPDGTTITMNWAIALDSQDAVKEENVQRYMGENNDNFIEGWKALPKEAKEIGHKLGKDGKLSPAQIAKIRIAEESE